jgi:hypothetical protein
MTKRALEYFNDPTTGVFKNNSSGDIEASELRDFVETGFGGFYWPGTNTALSTPAGLSGTVGQIDRLDLSGLSGHEIWRPPAVAAVGDICGFYIAAGDDTYELALRTETGDKIDGSSDYVSGDYSRYFITGEMVILKCLTADTDWAIIHENRIPCEFFMARTSALTGLTGTNTVTGYGAASINTGSCANNSTGIVTVRRSGRWLLGGRTRINAPGGVEIADQTKTNGVIVKNDSSGPEAIRTNAVLGGDDRPEMAPSGSIPVANDDTLRLKFYASNAHELGDTSWNYPVFHGMELLR